MNELQKKTLEAESRLRRDEYIITLEKSLDWFKAEAFRLSQQCQHHMTEAEKYKAEAEATAKDRDFLMQTLKSSMREARILKDKCRSQSPIRLPNVIKKQATTSTETPKADNFNKILAHYQHILDLERKDKRRLKAQKVEIWTSRNELEEVFIDCIEEVKRTKNYYDTPVTVMDPLDKRRILELFIANEKVIHRVRELMFQNSSATSIAFSPRSFSLKGDNSLVLSTARSSASGRRNKKAQRVIVGGKLLISDSEC
eukprot:CAMPEP_0204902154 /NCGR_PEP_ID=MMETSP1397-20131031/3497_1 /ASSEMBLY_ACC=CAM_ASM_000891 /TAXON_ID=49980 /ORGANISM="Climacostomum Climacostomum virens, Strain Stock W-24" /LENGTH=255 /DNA_ID=CAMNT_0052070611 /DNA_START=304 /DNA_END=1071 /DNA_ORIENTATION=+